MVELPNIEDKIYDLLADILSIEDFEKDEIKNLIDIAMDEMNMDMDVLISQLLEGVENGVPIEDQFNLLKILLKGNA